MKRLGWKWLTLACFGILFSFLPLLFVASVGGRSDGRNIPFDAGVLADPGCFVSGCHMSAGSTFNQAGSVSFNNLPASFVPGEIYDLGITMAGGSTYGFQVAVVFSDDTQAGTLMAVTERTLVDDVQGVQILTQTSPLVTNTVDFQWTAPMEPKEGSVILKVASNSANGNFSPTGDAINELEISIPQVELTEKLFFAHFANGTWITDLVFVNLETQPSRPAPTTFHTDILSSRPAIYFYDTEGNPIDPESVLDITSDLEVTEDGGLTIQTEMEPLGVLTISTHGRGALVTGSVRVVSDGPIGGMLRFEHPNLGVAGVGTSPPVSDALFPVRRQEGGINTGVALHNLESSPGLLRCDLMREGVLLDTVSIPLEANGQTAWLIDQAFPGADTSDFAGSVRCDAVGEGLFTAVALEMDPGKRIFTTLPVVPVDRTGGRGGETVLDFAHFANGTAWSTDLVFVNLETQPSGPAPAPFHTAIPPSRPAIYFYDTEGNPIDPASVVEVMGDLVVTEDGALTVRTEMEPLGVLTISTHGRGALVTGSVKVVSDGPIGGMLRFEHPALGVAGMGASPPVSDALFPVRRQEGGINTGVALHNLESSPGLLRCDLMREGVLLDAASIPLEANGQTAWLIDQAFPGADTSDFAGSVRCDAVGEGLFTAVALEMDPGKRIFTTLPVVPVADRMSQE